MSAIRAGLRPRTADLFGDADLRALAPAIAIDPDAYPASLDAWARTIEPTPWLYTGAIENHPDLVDAIARRHPLLGNPGVVLRRVRDPIGLARTIRSAGLPAPEVRDRPDGLPTDGSWLAKPRASGGGRGIRPWFGPSLGTPGSTHYWQQAVAGVGLAALYVGRGGDAERVGVTRQDVGRPGHPFAYRGSLGPWPVPPALASQLDRLGRVLAAEFDLVGLFGVDLVVNDAGAWPIEVNPRYTASVEVIERAAGRSLLAAHAQACGLDRADLPDVDRPRGGVVGKAIVSARSPLRWAGPAVEVVRLGTLWPDVADIPTRGSTIPAGRPVLTVFAHASTIADCHHRLAEQVRIWQAHLGRMADPVKPGAR